MVTANMFMRLRRLCVVAALVQPDDYVTFDVQSSKIVDLRDYDG